MLNLTFIKTKMKKALTLLYKQEVLGLIVMLNESLYISVEAFVLMFVGEYSDSCELTNAK
ncbi:hypothetical protein SHPE106448_08160 [Shewanella pealeana]